MKRGMLVTAMAAISTIAACGADGGPGAAQLEVSRDTIGDTIVVRTEAGSVWGAPQTLAPAVSIGVLEGDDPYMLGSVRALAVGPAGRIYVLDSQVPAVRMYSPDGAHLADIGRPGEGPGEYQEPDGGMAYLPDDRVAVRDPGTGKVVVFAADGEPLDDWRLTYGGGFSTSEGFYRDTAGHLLTPIITNLGATVTEWERGYLRYGPDGTVIDTLRPPERDFEEWIVSGENENSSSSSRVPFGPREVVRYSPLGYFVGGVGTDYRIEVYRPAGRILRIEKAWEPVPVNPDEASFQRRRIETSFRDRFPGWSWNGPAIPDTKPPWSDLYVGDDGRIWAVVATPSEEFMTRAEAAEEERATGRAPSRWRSPVAFDVFEPTGEYLGRVNTPAGFSLSPAPVFRGDTVWAVVRDEFDVQRVVRLEPAPRD